MEDDQLSLDNESCGETVQEPVDPDVFKNELGRLVNANDSFSAISRGFLDKILSEAGTSKIKDALDEGFAAQLKKSSRSNKISVQLPSVLSNEDRNYLEDKYAGFSIVLAYSNEQTHAFSAASRVLETFKLLVGHGVYPKTDYTKFVKTLNNDAMVIDIGGNPNFYIKHDVHNVHVECPVIDAADSNRHQKRVQCFNNFAAKSMTTEYKASANQQKLCSDFLSVVKSNHEELITESFCLRQSQNCNIKAHSAIMVHSVYDNTPEQVFDMMINHSVHVLTGTFLWDDMIIQTLTGVIPRQEAEWTIDLDKDTITFCFKGESSLGYVHSYSNYIRWTTESLVVHRGQQFMIELQEVIGGVRYFTVTRASVPRPSTYPSVHRVYFNQLEDKFLVRMPFEDAGLRASFFKSYREVFRTDPSSHLTMGERANAYRRERSGNILERYAVLKLHRGTKRTYLAFYVDKALVQSALSYSVNNVRSKFSVGELFTYIRAKNGTAIYGKEVIRRNVEEDTVKLFLAAFAIYVFGYEFKYKCGKSLQNSLQDCHNDRVLADKGFIRRFFASSGFCRFVKRILGIQAVSVVASNLSDKFYNDSKVFLGAMDYLSHPSTYIEFKGAVRSAGLKNQPVTMVLPESLDETLGLHIANVLKKQCARNNGVVFEDKDNLNRYSTLNFHQNDATKEVQLLGIQIPTLKRDIAYIDDPARSCTAYLDGDQKRFEKRIRIIIARAATPGVAVYVAVPNWAMFDLDRIEKFTSFFKVHMTVHYHVDFPFLRFSGDEFSKTSGEEQKSVRAQIDELKLEVVNAFSYHLRSSLTQDLHRVVLTKTACPFVPEKSFSLSPYDNPHNEQVEQVSSLLGQYNSSDLQKIKTLLFDESKVVKGADVATRAAAKLKQIVEMGNRDFLLAKSYLDLGVSPGGMAKYVKMNNPTCTYYAVSLKGVEGALAPKHEPKTIIRLDEDVENFDLLEPLDRQLIAYGLKDKKVDWVVADAAMDPLGYESKQESMNFQLFTAEVVVAVTNLRNGGAMILKIYDFNSIETRTLMVLISMMFSSVEIVKPYASFRVNKEKYIVARDFSICAAANVLPYLDGLLIGSEARLFSSTSVDVFDAVLVNLAERYTLDRLHALLRLRDYLDEHPEYKKSSSGEVDRPPSSISQKPCVGQCKESSPSPCDSHTPKNSVNTTIAPADTSIESSSRPPLVEPTNEAQPPSQNGTVILNVIRRGKLSTVTYEACILSHIDSTLFYKVCNTLGDGNCLFWALSKRMLNGSYLREYLTDQINNPRGWSGYVSADLRDELMHRTCDPGTATLQLLSETTNVRVTLIDQESKIAVSIHGVCQSQDGAGSDAMVYHSFGHFESIEVSCRQCWFFPNFQDLTVQLVNFDCFDPLELVSGRMGRYLFFNPTTGCYRCWFFQTLRSLNPLNIAKLKVDHLYWPETVVIPDAILENFDVVYVHELRFITPTSAVAVVERDNQVSPLHLLRSPNLQVDSSEQNSSPQLSSSERTFTPISDPETGECDLEVTMLMSQRPTPAPRKLYRPIPKPRTSIVQTKFETVAPKAETQSETSPGVVSNSKNVDDCTQREVSISRGATTDSSLRVLLNEDEELSLPTPQSTADEGGRNRSSTPIDNRKDVVKRTPDDKVRNKKIGSLCSTPESFLSAHQTLNADDEELDAAVSVSGCSEAERETKIDSVVLKGQLTIHDGDIKSAFKQSFNEHVVFAHCISRNLNESKSLSQGVAVAFKQEFGKPELKDIKPEYNCLAVQKFKNKTVIGIITKPLHFHKPKQNDYLKGVNQLGRYMKNNRLKILHIPMLGGSLDNVKPYIIVKAIQILLQEADVHLHLTAMYARDKQKASSNIAEIKERLKAVSAPTPTPTSPATVAVLNEQLTVVEIHEVPDQQELLPESKAECHQDESEVQLREQERRAQNDNDIQQAAQSDQEQSCLLPHQHSTSRLEEPGSEKEDVTRNNNELNQMTSLKTLTVRIGDQTVEVPTRFTELDDKLQYVALETWNDSLGRALLRHSMPAEAASSYLLSIGCTQADTIENVIDKFSNNNQVSVYKLDLVTGAEERFGDGNRAIILLYHLTRNEELCVTSLEPVCDYHIERNTQPISLGQATHHFNMPINMAIGNTITQQDQKMMCVPPSLNCLHCYTNRIIQTNFCAKILVRSDWFCDPGSGFKINTTFTPFGYNIIRSEKLQIDQPSNTENHSRIVKRHVRHVQTCANCANMCKDMILLSSKEFYFKTYCREFLKTFASGEVRYATERPTDLDVTIAIHRIETSQTHPHVKKSKERQIDVFAVFDNFNNSIIDAAYLGRLLIEKLESLKLKTPSFLVLFPRFCDVASLIDVLPADSSITFVATISNLQFRYTRTQITDKHSFIKNSINEQRYVWYTTATNAGNNAKLIYKPMVDKIKSHGVAVDKVDEASKDTSFGLYDARGMVWVHKPLKRSDDYEHAYYYDYNTERNVFVNFRGVSVNLQIQRGRAEAFRDTLPHHVNYVMVTSSTAIMNEAKLFDACADLQILRRRTQFGIHVVEGVPGGGKTTYILNQMSLEPDLDNIALSATTAARDNIIERVPEEKADKLKRIQKLKFKTLDSSIVSLRRYVNSTIDKVYVDEASMLHVGRMFIFTTFNKVNHLYICGDKAQIPYFNSDRIATSLHRVDPKITKAEVTNRTITHRCPMDVAHFLSNIKDSNGRKMYDRDVRTTRKAIRSLNVEICSSAIKAVVPECAQLLVFTQVEKTAVSHMFKNHASAGRVNTIAEYQGKECEHVVVFRTRNRTAEIYERADQMVVAISRHTKSFKYVTVIEDTFFKNIQKSIVVQTTQLKKYSVSLSGGGFVFNTARNVDDPVFPRLKEFRQLPEYEVRIAPDYVVNHRPENGVLTSIAEHHFSLGYVQPKPIFDLAPNLGLPILFDPIPPARVHPSLSLQFLVDDMFPGAGLYDNSMMNDIFNTSPLRIECCDFAIGPIDIKIPMYDCMRPTLRTCCPPLMQETQLYLLKTFNERNGVVPELEGRVHHYVLAESMMKNFVSTCVGDKELLNYYTRNPIEINVDSITEWITTQAPSIMKTLEATEIEHIGFLHLEKYYYMLKRMAKPCLDTNPEEKFSSPQAIAYQDKIVNAVFSPVIRDMKQRLYSVLRNDKIIASDMSVDDFETMLNRRFPPHMLDQFREKIETDFSKFDKSQGLLALEIDLRMMELFGVPEELRMMWIVMHLKTTLINIPNRFKAWVFYQRKSGDPMTFLGNTLYLMVTLAYLLGPSIRDAFCLFAGDDSYIFSKNKIDMTHLVDVAAALFNLETKALSFQYPYFCSKFLIPVNEFEWKVVPDLWKTVIKLGRPDLINPRHIEEYRISLVDNFHCLEYSQYFEIYADSLQERYKMPYSPVMCFSSLYWLLNDPAAFQELWFFTENDNIDFERLQLPSVEI